MYSGNESIKGLFYTLRYHIICCEANGEDKTVVGLRENCALCINYRL